jgi:hypothetical protein
VRARRTHLSTHVFTLQEGNEDNDLWGYFVPDEENPNLGILCTVWVPTDEERARIAGGENIRLALWSRRPYPMAMDVTDEPIGKKHEDE